jgi:hypothetical protein
MSRSALVLSFSVLLVCVASCGPTNPGPTNPSCSQCSADCGGNEWCARAKCSGVCPQAQGEGGGGCPASCEGECGDDTECLDGCTTYCGGTETETPETCEACIADHCGGGDEENQACIDEKCADACTSPAADAGP